MPDPKTEEILWYKPDPRAIIPLEEFHVSKSLRKLIHRKTYNFSINQSFLQVMKECANRPETWINQEIMDSYLQLHIEGGAHSVEIWRESSLVGGVYGVSLGGAFFAESKFHKESNTSKLALYHLVKHLKTRGFKLLEVQFITDHLKTLGAIEIPSQNYLRLLEIATNLNVQFV